MNALNIIFSNGSCKPLLINLMLINIKANLTGQIKLLHFMVLLWGFLEEK